MNHQNKGSTWRIWDLHLHSPCSILNNGFGDPQKSETWKEYINNIECKCREKNIAAIAITDYFTIAGYKRVKKYSDEGRLEGILVLPNIEFRLDKIITVNGLNPKRLNFHVILSPEIDPKDIEDRFLHELDFIYEEDTFESGERRKLKIRDLEDFGRQLKEEHPPFSDKNDLFIGCMNAVVDSNQIKKVLESKPSIFKGKYFIIFPGEGQSLLKWDSQLHGVRKHLLQMSHAIFSSELSTRDFGLGNLHRSKKAFLKEFKSLKPCIWGCDSHSFDDRFLEPDKNSQDKINYCWIKSELTWDGLKQIIYEPENRIRIQEDCPEPQKSIYTIDKFNIKNTKINPSLSISETELDLNHNMVAIIGGRGSGKTAILDLIASCYQEGKKLEKITNSFYHRLYCKEIENEAIPVKLTCVSQDSVEKNVGKDDAYLELADIIYLTQKHFEEFSSDNKKLNEYVLRLVFEKFPEKRKTYGEHESAISDKIKQIQDINLNLQHLEEEIKIKTDLEIKLKQKEGDRIDYAKRIQDIESQSKINKEANELSDKLTEQKNSKQKIESLVYKLNNVPMHIISLKNLINHLSESNKEVEQIRKERNIELALFPETDLAKYLELINETAKENGDILISELEQIEKDLSDIRGRLQQFQDIDKALTDLKQKQNVIFEEIKEINIQINIARKKEEEIVISKGSRLLLFVDVLQEYVVLKDFIKEMMELFEMGKNEILNGLSFDATITINENRYIAGINSVINNRMISEKDVRLQLKANILDLTKEIVKMDENNQEYESKLFELRENFEKELQEFPSKLRKHTTYSEFYNNLFAVPVEIEIKISLEKISLESLSMGQKAIVLLKIILAYDDKPLIIDQPEEDLDNRYIYEQLVPAFRAAKERRQIIIATHNANLTVNTDAEQIIIAKYDAGRISYEAGSLENPSTRKHIKEILEGGDEAFEKREEKYGYRF